MYIIHRDLPDGTWQKISSCESHIARTMMEFGTTDVKIIAADPIMHTCMGCLKNWPTGTS